MKNDYAIIIGINHYTPPEEDGLKTLNGAINDANAVEDWVKNQNGGNVPEGNVYKIISRPNPLKPLQDEIDDAFLLIEKKILKSEGAARRLYFYFAGHGLGTLDNTTNTALCMANWSENRRHSALSSEAYKDIFRQYGYFEEIIFIADCCRNTKINVKPIPPTFSPVRPGGDAGRTKLFIGYATQYQDQSYEVAAGGSEARGVFTKVLLDGLKGAAGSNGNIKARSLEDYLRRLTPVEAHKNGYKQDPDVINTFGSDDTIVAITGSVVDRLCSIVFSGSRNNIIELQNGSLEVIASYDATVNKNVRLTLPKGLYALRDNMTDEKHTFEVLPSDETLIINF